MSLIPYITRVHFADRVLEDALAEETLRNGIRRPLLVSEAGAGGAEARDRLLDALPVDVTPVHLILSRSRSLDDLCADGAGILGDGRCDGIVAFGGALPLDLARHLGDSGLPVLAIPTTTDTIGLGPLAPEFGGHATRRARVPEAILCDPTLTTEADSEATAASGMSVLVHCLESYLSTSFNPPADGMALDGLRRAAQSLEAAVADGRDLDARRELLAAALNAGLAAEKGFGGIEAAAHGLGAAGPRRPGVFHGALVSQVLAFNAPVISDRFSAIRATLGLSRRADIAGHLADLARRIGLPLRLSDAGIAAPILPQAAQRAAAAPSNRTNPRHATASDYETILRATL